MAKLGRVLRKLGISLVTVLAIAAVMANSASAAVSTTAANFWVAGVGPGTKTMTGSAVTSAVLETTIAGTPVKLESAKFSCSGCKILNKEVTSKAGTIAFGEGKLVFEEAKVVTPAGCTVKGETGVAGTITTKALVIHGDWMDTNTENQHAFVQFMPTAGTTLGQIQLSGGGCEAISGTYNVTGTVFGESTNNTGVEAAKQELVFSPTVQTTTGASLKVGANAASLKSTDAFELSTKEKFMIKPGVPPEATTLTTSLSGESKSGASITVNEGSKVKDQATLAGVNVAKATGKVSYAVYQDSSCKELATSAGEVEVKEGKVPASEEVNLAGGKVYYWLAHYGGDSLNAESTSACGSEVLTVKAATTLTTNLLGGNPASEEELLEGAEIDLTQGFPVGDTATLAGTNSATATGNILFKLYSDSECKTLIKGFGTAAVEKGELTVRSAELELAPGTYYAQAEYEGDSLHQSSKSACGSEVIKVRAPTTIATKMEGGAVVEVGEFGEVMEIAEGKEVFDTSTLEGVNAATAGGTVEYEIYSDAECTVLAKAAGTVAVTKGKVPNSEGVKTLKAGVYFFQARYSGDANNAPSFSECGSEILEVLEEKPPAKQILHKENAEGPALALGTKVLGSSKSILFITEGPWYLPFPFKWVIECTKSPLEGEVVLNAANLGVVNLSAWTLEGGAAKAARCSTTMVEKGEAVEAVMTVINRGNLRVTRAAGATIGPFELKEELFIPSVEKPLLTCRFGRQAVPALFAFNVPFGLTLAATNWNRLMRAPGNPWNCGTTLGMMGTLELKTKEGEKAVVPV